MSKNLIIYYSRRGENYVNGRIENLKKGNTEICAEYIQKAVGGDLFEIQTVEDYAKDYRKCTEEAAQEIRSNARPKLIKYLETIAAYDNVFVCGPCWWGTFPMPVFSQIERLNFTGKKVMVLMTHEGSGLASIPRTLRNICDGATVADGFAIAGTAAQNNQAEARKAVIEWLASNK